MVGFKKDIESMQLQEVVRIKEKKLDKACEEFKVALIMYASGLTGERILANTERGIGQEFPIGICSKDLYDKRGIINKAADELKIAKNFLAKTIKEES